MECKNTKISDDIFFLILEPCSCPPCVGKKWSLYYIKKYIIQGNKCFLRNWPFSHFYPHVIHHKHRKDYFSITLVNEYMIRIYIHDSRPVILKNRKAGECRKLVTKTKPVIKKIVGTRVYRAQAKYTRRAVHTSRRVWRCAFAIARLKMSGLQNPGELNKRKCQMNPPKLS